MRTGLKCFFLVSFIFLGLASGRAALAAELTGSPHIDRAKEKCVLCHTQRIPQLIDDYVETCTNCHAGNIDNHPVTRHPIDVEVNIEIPGPLPLTKENRIVCSTCHDPHNEYGFSSMLRVQYHTLCIQCHRGY